MLFLILLFPTEMDRLMLEILMVTTQLVLLLDQSKWTVMELQDLSKSKVWLIIFLKLSVQEFIHHIEEVLLNFIHLIYIPKLMDIQSIIIMVVIYKEDVEVMDQ